jgi:hypothetical protein
MLGIPYKGPWKYTEPEHVAKYTAISEKLVRLKPLIPNGTPEHTAEHGARYDFTFTDAKTGEVKHWSAKSTKNRYAKIAPQEIGQATSKQFCKLVGCPELSIPELKQYIQSSDNIPVILQLLSDNTFSCPVVYYNEARDDIKYITACRPINWHELKFEWTRSHELWTNSSTLKVVKPGTTEAISLVEFQFHTKRKNMAIRWCFENLLSSFSDSFEIIQIHQKTTESPSTPSGARANPVAASGTMPNSVSAPVKKNQAPDDECQPKRELEPKRLVLGQPSG